MLQVLCGYLESLWQQYQWESHHNACSHTGTSLYTVHLCFGVLCWIASVLLSVLLSSHSHSVCLYKCILLVTQHCYAICIVPSASFWNYILRQHQICKVPMRLGFKLCPIFYLSRLNKKKKKIDGVNLHINKKISHKWKGNIHCSYIASCSFSLLHHDSPVMLSLSGDLGFCSTPPIPTPNLLSITESL